MKVRFFGVRGSIATAGDETRRYGGNTSCVVVEAGGERVIFDAGTGIRKYGNELVREKGVEAHLFFSHLHWDHIQGFPFFAPAFVPGNRLSVYGVKPPSEIDVDGHPATLQLQPAARAPREAAGQRAGAIPGAGRQGFAEALHADESLEGGPVIDTSSVKAAMAAQMTAPNFPVGLDVMRADLRFFDVPYGERILLGCPAQPLVVRHVGVDHPNGCVAYRVEHGPRSMVYATDLELAEGTDGNVFDSLVELARGADLLVFDAMYTPEEYEGKGTFSRRGWGHSTYEMGAAVAAAAGVRELCLFHHDPGHDDAFLDRLHERARARFSSTSIAREGLELAL